MKINLTDKQKGSLKWWAFFFLAMGVLSVIVYYSTKEAYPELLKLALGCMLLSTGAAAYNHSMADEPDMWVKVPAICGMVLIAALDIGNLWGHVSLARDLSASGAAETERKEKQQWDLGIDAQRAKIQADRNASDAELAKAEAARANAEARRYNSLPLSQRIALGPPRKPTPKPTPDTTGTADTALASGVALPTPTPSEEEVERKRLANMTKAEVRAEWRWYFSTILLLTVAVSVLVCFVTRGLKMLDSDRNGVPDYVDRTFKADEAMCARLYPAEYAKLIGQRAQQQAAANAPSYAPGNP